MKYFLFLCFSFSFSFGISAEICKVELKDKDKKVIKTFESAEGCQVPQKECRREQRKLKLEEAECLKAASILPEEPKPEETEPEREETPPQEVPRRDPPQNEPPRRQHTPEVPHYEEPSNEEPRYEEQRFVCMGVDMVDSWGRVTRTYELLGDNEICYEGLKRCRKDTRMVSSYRGNNCVKRNVQIPSRPLPVDVQMPLRTGDRAYYGFDLVVIESNNYGYYSIRTLDGNRSWGGVSRANLSLTEGCQRDDVCIGDEVLTGYENRPHVVVGLNFFGTFTVKTLDGNGMSGGVSLERLSFTRGCVSSRHGQVCVGDRVLTWNNQAFQVTSIKRTGTVNIEQRFSYGSSMLFNVDPNSLTVVR